MTKTRQAVLITLLLSGGLAFIFRNQLINGIQQQLIRNIGAKAVVDNRSLLQTPSFSHHLLYTLKGTERLWPHRVNSLQRFRYLYPQFAGFECDIQFLESNGALSIGHDRPGPDQFADYLIADSPRRKLFWLDIKNVNAGNIKAFCAQLQSLDRQYAIRNRVIIECYDTLTALPVSEQGFLTGLNISWLADDARVMAVRGLCPGRINLLSGESIAHPSITRDFPGRKQINWDIRFLNGMDRDNLLRQANDTDLLVCLINVKSPGYR